MNEANHIRIRVNKPKSSIIMNFVIIANHSNSAPDLMLQEDPLVLVIKIIR